MTTSPRAMSSVCDVVVVGARVAGAATAMLLARRGLDVLVLDRGESGDDTLSTHALMRAGVLQLDRWGLLEAVKAAGTPPIRRTTFHYGDSVVEIPIVPSQGVDALYAPRRTVLDPIVVAAARDAGATVLSRTRLVGLGRDATGRVDGVVIERDGRTETVGAKMVVGADGINSTVARLVDAPIDRQLPHAAGTIYGYWAGLPLDGYHWYFRPGVSAGVIPTNDGAFAVSVTLPGDRFRRDARGAVGVARTFREVVGEVSPVLARQIGAAQPLAGLRGFPGAPGRLRRATGPGWALVGDAGYFKDPITAHGISDAFRDAELVARAIVAGEGALAGYQATRDALSEELLQVTDRIAAFDWTLDEVQALHRAFSDSMKAETRYLRGLTDQEDAMAGASS